MASKHGKNGSSKRWGTPKGEIGYPIKKTWGNDDSSSSSSSSSSFSSREKRREEGGGEKALPPNNGSKINPNPKDETVRRLLQVLERTTKCPNRPDTSRRFIEAWLEKMPAADLEALLTDKKCRGLSVIEIGDLYLRKRGPTLEEQVESLTAYMAQKGQENASQ